MDEAGVITTQNLRGYCNPLDGDRNLDEGREWRNGPEKIDPAVEAEEREGMEAGHLEEVECSCMQCLSSCFSWNCVCGFLLKCCLYALKSM